MDKYYTDSRMKNSEFRCKWYDWCKQHNALLIRNIRELKKDILDYRQEEALIRRESGFEVGTVEQEREVWFHMLSKYSALHIERLEARLQHLLKDYDRMTKGFDEKGDVKDTPITEVLERYGITINQSGFIISPYHNEKTPSCKIYIASNSFYDFSMSKGGSVIDLVMALENCTLKRAYEILEGK
jgi:hypothetical protein